MCTTAVRSALSDPLAFLSHWGCTRPSSPTHPRRGPHPSPILWAAFLWLTSRPTFLVKPYKIDSLRLFVASNSRVPAQWHVRGFNHLHQRKRASWGWRQQAAPSRGKIRRDSRGVASKSPGSVIILKPRSSAGFSSFPFHFFPSKCSQEQTISDLLTVNHMLFQIPRIPTAALSSPGQMPPHRADTEGGNDLSPETMHVQFRQTTLLLLCLALLSFFPLY